MSDVSEMDGAAMPAPSIPAETPAARLLARYERRLIWFLLIILAFLLVGVSGLIAFEESQYLEETLNTRGAALVQHLSMLAPEFILSSDVRRLRDMAHIAMRTDDDVQGVAFYMCDGRRLVGVGEVGDLPFKIDKVGSVISTVDNDMGKDRVFLGPVMTSAGRHVGLCYVRQTRHKMWKRVLLLASKLDLLILSIFLAAAVLIHSLLKRVRRLAAQEAKAASLVRSQSTELRSTNLRLANTIEKLKEAAEIRAKFISMVSHELRTPLTVIIGFAQILAENIAQYDKPTIKRYLELMDSDAHRLLRLIEGLLDLSRIERHGLQLHPVEFDLRLLSQTLIEGFKASRPDHEIGLTLGEGLSAVCHDKDRIEQILVNFIDNAMKYSPKGSKVHIDLMRHGPDLLVQVTDAGEGIPDDFKGKIFEPFFRTPDAISRRTPGTGLGLAVVKAIVDAIGGKILVQDAQPHGTRFVCSLPEAKKSLEAPVPVTQAA